MAKNKLSSLCAASHMRRAVVVLREADPTTILGRGIKKTLATSSFNKSFKIFYDENGKKAGKYLFDGVNWTISDTEGKGA